MAATHKVKMLTIRGGEMWLAEGEPELIQEIGNSMGLKPRTLNGSPRHSASLILRILMYDEAIRRKLYKGNNPLIQSNQTKHTQETGNGKAASGKRANGSSASHKAGLRGRKEEGSQSRN